MNGLLVSNTGPIIALAGVAQLGLLRRVFQRVTIPTAVAEELQHGPRNEAALIAVAEATDETRDLSREPDPLLLRTLDRGEASVIALAIETRADWVLMDERKGRKIASEVYGLQVVGTAGLLVYAKRRGFLASVGPLLQAMRDNGYWLHDGIVRWALHAADEE